MKTVLVAINSKYIHSSLSTWYLKAVCDVSIAQINILEYSINDNLENILGGIYEEKPDVVAFSCYIWNISHVLKLAQNLKIIDKNITIILGGSEVSFETRDLMNHNSFIDYVIIGEGEKNVSLSIVED